MRVVKQVFLELHNDVSTAASYIAPRILTIFKWICVFLVGVAILLGILKGYLALGMSEDTSGALGALTFCAIVGLGVWIKLAYSRAKERMSAQRRELLDTIAGSTKTHPDVDTYIRRVKKQPQGNTP